LVITVDERVAWYSRRQGPVGALRQVRLACVPASGTVRGAVACDDFSLARAVEPLPHTAADPGQDEAWPLSGDQGCGQAGKGDRRTVALRGAFGERSLEWGELRGLFPRRDASPPQTITGDHVRLWLRPEAGLEPDELEGV